MNLGLWTGLENVEVYFYSEETPTAEGNYWYYEDGEVTIWEVQEDETPEVVEPEEETEEVEVA